MAARIMTSQYPAVWTCPEACRGPAGGCGGGRSASPGPLRWGRGAFLVPTKIMLDFYDAAITVF